jgi:hypothetical protein
MAEQQLGVEAGTVFQPAAGQILRGPAEHAGDGPIGLPRGLGHGIHSGGRVGSPRLRTSAPWQGAGSEQGFGWSTEYQRPGL